MFEEEEGEEKVRKAGRERVLKGECSILGMFSLTECGIPIILCMYFRRADRVKGVSWLRLFYRTYT